jgi:hypothetical protein
LFVLEVTSKAAEAAGFFVPMPICAKVFALIDRISMTNTYLELVIMLLKFLLKRGK